MKKLFLISFFACVGFVLTSCSSDDKDEIEIFNDIEIVVERTSNNFDVFTGGNIITIPNKAGNHTYNEKDFSTTGKDLETIMLSKLVQPFNAKSSYKLKQKDVEIQFLETPQINDDLELSEEAIENANLVSKVKIFVNGKVVKEETFTFHQNGANLFLLKYKK